MRALAEFVMRGRAQALLVTVVSAGTVLFYWVGAAVLGLVTLRRGQAEGLWLLFWAALPAAALAWYGGEIAPLVVLAGTWVAASVLRQTQSWALALVLATGFTLVVAVTVYQWQPQWLAEVHSAVEQFFSQFQQQLKNAQGEVPLLAPSVLQIVGLLGLVQAMAVAVCLVLARSWQAQLYNPGGFSAEFHQLRLPLVLALPLGLGAMALMAQGLDTVPWAYLLAMPLLIAGIALVHGLRGQKRWHGRWLVMFYGLLILINPVKDLVILAALLDSVLDFRGRAARQQS